MPVKDALTDKQYFRGRGPDFLQRLEGNLTPVDDGLLTFIYATELEEQALPVEDYSMAAHSYFSDISGCYKVKNLPGWFRLTLAETQEYGIEDISYMVC